MSWGEDDRDPINHFFVDAKKCYYCGELKLSKLTKLEGRVVCRKCLHTIADIAERNRIAEKEVKKIIVERGKK